LWACGSRTLYSPILDPSHTPTNRRKMATSAVPMKMSKSIERNLAEVAPTAVKAMDSAKSLVASSYEKATVYAKAAKVKTMVVVKDKTFQVTAASAAGGAAACGATGATVGMVTGGAIGAMVGVVPALLTFGLSIPAGAAIGGGCGAMAGATTGGTVGAVGGGAAGYGAFTRREKISAKGRQIYAQAMAAVSGARAKGLKYKADAVKLVEDRVATTKAKALAAFGAAKAKTTERATAAKAKSIEIASNKTVQVTAASATGGAVVLGAGGAATGLAAGGTIGAAIGVIPALFTFGLSIPVGAMIGGGCGLVAGTAVGSTTGLVVGGTTGYGAYTKRDEIKSGVSASYVKVSETAEYAKSKASEAAGQVRARIAG